MTQVWRDPFWFVTALRTWGPGRGSRKQEPAAPGDRTSCLERQQHGDLWATAVSLRGPLTSPHTTKCWPNLENGAWVPRPGVSIHFADFALVLQHNWYPLTLCVTDLHCLLLPQQARRTWDLPAGTLFKPLPHGRILTKPYFAAAVGGLWLEQMSFTK